MNRAFFVKIFILFCLLSVFKGFSQTPEDTHLIYEESIDEVNKIYDIDKIYFANHTLNEFFLFFDSTEIEKRFRVNFRKACSDLTFKEFDFSTINKNIKTIRLQDLKKNFYGSFRKESKNKFKGSLIRFSSPIFDETGNYCIVCVDHWCGGDCGETYFLYLERKKGGSLEEY